MKFTNRTYRRAIKKSKQEEERLLEYLRDAPLLPSERYHNLLRLRKVARITCRLMERFQHKLRSERVYREIKDPFEW